MLKLNELNFRQIDQDLFSAFSDNLW